MRLFWSVLMIGVLPVALLYALVTLARWGW